jgi:hypothetical protein
MLKNLVYSSSQLTLLKDFVDVARKVKNQIYCELDCLFDRIYRLEKLDILMQTLMFHSISQKFGDFKQVVMQTIRDSHKLPYFAMNSADVEAALLSLGSIIGSNVKFVIQILCLNDGRKRRQLIESLQRWDAIEMQVSSADERLHKLYRTMGGAKNVRAPCPYYFSAWLNALKFKIGYFVWDLGFCLDLYSKYEYAIVYR